MKSSIVLCLAIVACGGTTVAPVNNPEPCAVAPEASKSPTHDMDVQLEKEYQASIQRIEDRMIWEKSVLEEDLHDKEFKKFAEDRKKFCAVDQMLDSKGQMHFKSYCQ